MEGPEGMVGTVKVTVGGALRILGAFLGALGLCGSLGCVSHEALTATLISEGADRVCILGLCWGNLWETRGFIKSGFYIDDIILILFIYCQNYENSLQIDYNLILTKEKK